MKWLERLWAWRVNQQHARQQALADLDMLIYGCAFLKIDSKGRKTRIDPTKYFQLRGTEATHVLHDDIN